MKRIIILCDGTWNAPRAKSPTHVERLAKSILPVGADGVKQMVLYYPGVGEGRGPTWLNRFMDRILGGAFGIGLLDNMRVAYRDLCLNFDPGTDGGPQDEIFIFGFSRGAFTARSLVGLMRVGGIPDQKHVGEIDEIIARYMKSKGKVGADAEELVRFRAEMSPQLTTSDKDIEWRDDKNKPEPVARLKIDYMGIWDTVGGIGLPGMLGWIATVFNKKHRFHDMNLSRSVRAARHALAIDEQRKLYRQTGWNNIDDLNGDEVTGEERVYLQQWFPGTHPVVGGRSPIVGLTASSFLWVWQGAYDKGMRIDPGVVAELEAQEDPLAERRGLRQAGMLSFIPFLMAHRTKGPKQLSDVSDSAIARVKGVQSYRPKTLKAVLADILSTD